MQKQLFNSWADTRKLHEAASGDVQVRCYEKVLHWEGGQSLGQIPPEAFMSPNFSDFTEHLDNALSHVV